MTAHSAVTTTVSRTVFQSSVQVSGRKMSCVTFDQAGAAGLDEQEDQRQGQHRGDQGADRRAARPRAGGAGRPGAERAGCPVLVALPRLRASGARGSTAVTAGPPARSSATAVEPSPSSPMVIGFGCSWLNGVSGAERRHAGRERVLEALSDPWAADDLLALLADQEGQEPLRGGLMRAGLQHGRAGDVDHVAGVVRGEVGDLRVHGRRADLGPQPVPVVLVDRRRTRPAPRFTSSAIVSLSGSM